MSQIISKKINILIVDDNPDNIQVAANFLIEQGYNISFDLDGTKVLQHLKSVKSDLILLDIMMPEMDGYEAMKRIRSQIKFRNLPIIALTAKAMKDDKQKCIDAGANDYITKPIYIERLLSLMRVWLSK